VPAEEGAGSEASEWEPGAPGAGRGEGGGDRGTRCHRGIRCWGGATAVPTHAPFQGIRGRRVGDGLRSILSFSFAPHARMTAFPL